MVSLIFLGVMIIYFVKFHPQVLSRLGLSSRDDALMGIGLFIGVVLRNMMMFLEGLFTYGTILLGELFIALVFVYLIKSKYDRL